MRRIPDKKVKNYSPELLMILQISAITKTSTESGSDTEKSESFEDEDEL